jgi:uncharacterized membrane protein
MSHGQTQALVALFASSLGAGDTLASLREAGVVNVTTIQNSAVLRADAFGKLHVFVTTDRSGRDGAVIGGVAGGIVGLLGSAVASPLALRTVVAGLATELREAGFPSTDLNALCARVQPGYSLLIVAVAGGTAIEATLQGAGATVVRMVIDGQLTAALDRTAGALTAAVYRSFDGGTHPSDGSRSTAGPVMPRVPISIGQSV